MRIGFPQEGSTNGDCKNSSGLSGCAYGGTKVSILAKDVGPRIWCFCAVAENGCRAFCAAYLISTMCAIGLLKYIAELFWKGAPQARRSKP